MTPLGPVGAPVSAESSERSRREPRPPVSRIIDELTDALGDERAFAVSAVVVVVALVGGLVTGHVEWIASISALVTFVMVFAIQHTSSRESRALNVKLDELIRVTNARNDLIGAEDESHGQLQERSQDLLREREPGPGATSTL